MGALPSSDAPLLQDVQTMVCDYCANGWRVLPTKGKRPVLKDWPHAASNDFGIVKQWFKPGFNIGIAAGQDSGIVVLDIDPRNGGELSLQRLKHELGELPQTLTANTGGGGQHFVFQYFDGAKKCVAAEGIDFISDGGMFIAAPSVHPDTGVIYEWATSVSERAPAALPEPWQIYLGSPKNAMEPLGEIPEGSRNDALFKLGCSLAGKGIKPHNITIKLQETNLLQCQPPLDDKEVLAIAERCAEFRPNNSPFIYQWRDAVMADESLDPYAKVTLWGLSRFANNDGQSCYPNIEHISERTAIAERTVRKHLKDANSVWFDRYPIGREGQYGYSYGYVLKFKNGKSYRC